MDCFQISYYSLMRNILLCSTSSHLMKTSHFLLPFFAFSDSSNSPKSCGVPQGCGLILVRFVFMFLFMKIHPGLIVRAILSRPEAVQNSANTHPMTWHYTLHPDTCLISNYKSLIEYTNLNMG